MWIAVRMYEPSHKIFWNELKQSYSKNLIMKRYCHDKTF